MPSGLCESGEVLPGLRWESPPGRLPHPGPSPNSHLRNCSRHTTDRGLTVHLHGTGLGLVGRREAGADEGAHLPGDGTSFFPTLSLGPLSVNQGGSE